MLPRKACSPSGIHLGNMPGQPGALLAGPKTGPWLPWEAGTYWSLWELTPLSLPPVPSPRPLGHSRMGSGRAELSGT